MNFTKPKFPRLPLPQQHKKCAELLKIIHNAHLEGKTYEDLYSIYTEIISWMNEDSKAINTVKDICDLYHYHLGKAKFQIGEPQYLPKVNQCDRPSPKRAPLKTHIYLDHLRSAHNVGSIIRTTEAFALGDIYFSESTPTTENDQVRKTSMGAFEWINCHSKTRLTDLPQPIICLETAADAIPLYDFVFPDTFTLVVGNEEYGCSDQALCLASFIVEIPLYGKKNSLNVANAFAIAAAEIIRQKGPL